MNKPDVLDPLAGDDLALRLSDLAMEVPPFQLRKAATQVTRLRLLQGQSRLRRRRVLVSLALAACIALALSMAAAAASGKVPFNPWAGLSDQQKQAEVDKTHAENARYLRDFQARHGDVRSLPVIKISTWAPPSKSVGAAAAQAGAIVHGYVETVHFTANPTGGMPQMDATVRITDVGKGSVSSTIVVRQSGGPVARPGGNGALVELEYEHLILPGDEVVLLLSPTRGSNSEYRLIYGPGALLVESGHFAGEAAKRYGLDQRSFAASWKSLINPSLEPNAFPLQ
jgi:hypothetical protein